MPKDRSKSSGPSVVEGKIIRLSVSSVEKFDRTTRFGCERAWWFRYVQRLPSPQPAAAKLGEDIHGQLEHYLLTGENVLGREAMKARHLLPPPKVGLTCEMPLEPGVLTARGIPFEGYIDFLNHTGFYVDPSGKARKEGLLVHEAGDHKTTSSIADNAKTPVQLKESVQMVGYGVHEFRRKPELEGVRLSHIYIPTRGKEDAEKVTTVISRDAAESFWAGRVEPLVARMQTAAALADVAALEPSLDKCGRCPYVQLCPKADPLSFITDAEGDSVSLFSKFAPSASPNPNPVSVPTAAALTSTATTAPVNAPVAILPPDAPKSDPKKAADLVPDAPANVIAANPTIYASNSAPVESVSPSVNTPRNISSVVSPATQAEAQEKQKRHRRTKAEMEAARLGQPVKLGTPETTAPQALTPGVLTYTLAAFSTEPEAPLQVLYVNCRPTHSVSEDLGAYVTRLATQLGESQKVLDIRCAAKESPLAYGGWRGALAAKARASLPTGAAYHVHTGTDFVDVVVEAIAPFFDEVVR